ncbi:MAG: hypothetical protein NTV98_04180 [Candidatus Roizmanbacteria bacterium]|nr:hypothetical protein [Candidatus Roizmanbacteria bacterium]
MNKDNSEEKPSVECCKNKNIFKHHHGKSAGNPIYGLGVIGALFYFLKGATTFSAVMMGIGKSVFWPAILMFKLLTYLKM